MENLNEYKDAYKTSFRFYDENHWYLGLYAKLMCQSIRVNNLKSVLSLGLGHNVVSSELISMLGKNIDVYHIVEGSPDIIRSFLENQNTENLKIYESYFENFEPEIKYVAIEMGFVLEHVDDPLLIVNRFKNFLSPEGRIFISVPNAKSLHRLIGQKAGLLDDIYKLSPYDLELGHKRYFDFQILSNLAKESGLRIVDQKGLMLKPITGDQMRTLGWNQDIINALLEVGLEYPEIGNCMYIETKVE